MTFVPLISKRHQSGQSQRNLQVKHFALW